MLTKEAAPQNGHDSETPYLAELGKGILLANAKIKLIDEQLVSQSQALQQRVYLVSDRLETLTRSSEVNHAELQSSVKREARDLRKYLEEMRQAQAAVVTETGQQVAGWLKAHGETSRSQITETRDRVLAQQQETCTALMKACSSLAAKVDTTSERVSTTARDLTILTDAATRQLKCWLLGLTVLTIALSGTVLYLLAQVLRKGGG